MGQQRQQGGYIYNLLERQAKCVNLYNLKACGNTNYKTQEGLQ